MSIKSGESYLIEAVIEMSKSPAKCVDLYVFEFLNIYADFASTHIIGGFLFHEIVKSGRHLNGLLHMKVS